MTKIAFVEFGGSHMEIVYSFANLLQRKGCEVHLICNEKTLKNLPHKTIVDKIKLVPENSKKLQQLRMYLDVRKYLIENNINYVIIGTTEIKMIRDFSFFIRGFNTTGIVHNIKKLEKRWTSLRLGFKNIKKFLVLGKHLLDNMKPAENYNVNYFIPSYFPDIKKLNPIKPVNDFWVVIPGGVEQFRRDYVSFIQHLDNVNLPDNIKFIFLGSLWDEREKEICHALDNLQKHRDTIITFNHFVDYDIFHSYLQQSDMVLPLFKPDDTDWYMDKRMSGSTPLGIAYHIPFMLPNTYLSNSDISPYSVFYKDYNELFDKVVQFAKEDCENEKITERYKQNFSDDFTQKEADRLFEFITS